MLAVPVVFLRQGACDAKSSSRWHPVGDICHCRFGIGSVCCEPTNSPGCADHVLDEGHNSLFILGFRNDLCGDALCYWFMGVGHLPCHRGRYAARSSYYYRANMRKHCYKRIHLHHNECNNNMVCWQNAVRSRLVVQLHCGIKPGNRNRDELLQPPSRWCSFDKQQ